MSLSYGSFLGNGTNSIFSVSFPYLSKAHVKVYIDGVEDTSFTWLTSSSITTSTVPANGAVVTIKRTTPTTPQVDFVDGSTLTENLLDTATIQALYVAEESKDSLTGLILLDTLDSKFDGQGKVIKNVANPSSPQDVVTKAWAEETLVSQAESYANSALNSKNSAESYANSALNSKNSAESYANSALNSKNSAESYANSAEESASTALNAIGGVKVSATDSTATPLSSALQAGNNISLEVLNPGGNETLRISGAASQLPGEVCAFAMTSAPDGFLKANGAVVSRALYSALFANIGTTFGVGDGSTTFKLPDLRGQFIRGWDDARGLDVSRVFGSSQADSFKSHTHVQNAHSHGFSAATGTSNKSDGGVSGGGVSGSGGTTSAATATNQNTGDVETRPTNVALLICIKY